MCAQESQEASAAREEEKRALVKEHKRTERELTKQGKKPFYLKKCKRNAVHQVVYCMLSKLVHYQQLITI